MKAKDTPIALFTYNRPDHAHRVLESLSQCARLNECRLHIYCDGAKQPASTDAVEANRKVVRDWAKRLGAEVIEREENLGLARSVVAGVTELCKTYGRVIVLEDDFVLNPDFLNYMLQALDYYEDEPQVYQISGYTHPVAHTTKSDAFFLPLITCWGWATWARAWQIFDWNAAGALKHLSDSQERYRFDLDGSYPYAAMLEARLSGKIDSWGILWYWSVFKAKGLVLHPRQSLVWNRGFDGSGTHCGAESNINQSFMEECMKAKVKITVIFPDKIASDEAAVKKIKHFLHMEQQGGSSFWTILRRRIKESIR